MGIGGTIILLFVGSLLAGTFIAFIAEGVIEARISEKIYGKNPINTDYYQKVSMRKCRETPTHLEFNGSRFGIILLMSGLIIFAFLIYRYI